LHRTKTTKLNNYEFDVKICRNNNSVVLVWDMMLVADYFRVYADDELLAETAVWAM
jgi:hypothetical protein